MAQRGRTSTLKVENFSDGLNTRFANTEIKASESPDLNNVQFDFKGEIRKRNGYEKVTTSGIGSGSPALDQFIYIKNDGTQEQLVSSGTDVYKRTSPDGDPWSSIKSGLTNGSRFSYVQVDDLVYCSNDDDTVFKYDGTTTTDVATIPTGNIMIYFQEKLWVAGDSDNPSRLSHSKTNSVANDVEDFTTGDSGFLLIGKDDGQKITALRAFGNQLIVFKERSTYRVFFNEGFDAYAQELVDPVFGCIGKDAAVNVQNDVFFFTGKEVRRLGFDASYFEQVRTASISENIEDQLDNLSNPENTYTAFDGDKFYLAVSKSVSTVDTVFVLDTRYRGWMKWDSLNINGFLYDGKNDRLYWSSSSTDRVYLFNDSYSDDGTAISALWTSKRFDLDNPDLYKRFRWLHVTSRNVPGSLNVQTEILNNQAVFKTDPVEFPIGQNTPEGVWGAYVYGFDPFGGAVDNIDDPELIYNRISIGGPRGISVRFVFKNENLDEDLSIQSISLIFSTKDAKFYPSSYTR